MASKDPIALVAALQDPNVQAFLRLTTAARCRKRLLNRPFAKALVHRGFRYTNLSRPSRRRQGLAIEREFPRGYSIVVLLQSCFPRAVVRAVVAIVVPPFQRVAWRRLAHVCKKLVRVVPRWNHADSSAAISGISSGGWGVTPAHHSSPAQIPLGTTARAKTMLGGYLAQCFCRRFTAKAATRLTQPIHQMRCEFGRVRAAITNAIPARFWLSCQKRYHSEPAKSTARQVNEVMRSHAYQFLCCSLSIREGASV